MNCIYLNYLPTTKEYFYKATEDCTVNITVCNTHTASLAVTITLNVNGGASVAIFNDTMTAGEIVTFADCAINAGMAIGGLAGSANYVSVKVDKQ